MFSLLRRALGRARRALAFGLQAPFAMLYFTGRGIRWDASWTLHGIPTVRVGPTAKISIGKRFQAVSRSSHNSIGVIQPVILTAHGPGSRLTIGDDLGVSGASITAYQGISIGHRVLIGSGALITDNDAHPLHPEGRRYGKEFASAPVTIGDDVFIGARAMVLKGVTVGEGAVVGAAAVVAKDVPPYAVVVGNPARVVGDSRKAPRPRTV